MATVDDDWGIRHPTKGSNGKSESVKQEESWAVKRDRDLKHCQQVAGSWLPFSLAKSNWISLTSDSKLRDALDFPLNLKSIESVDEWTTRIQQALCLYVLVEMIMKAADRVQQFQALGRGWVFILLHSTELTKYTRMKVWFESSDRVLHDHEMDMQAADLSGATRDKYVWGYNPESELVFFIKGLAPARPLVCIQRLRPEYRDLDKWAVKPEAKIKCLDGKLPSDAEREKVVRQHQRRKRQRNKGKAKERETKAEDRSVAEKVALELFARHRDGRGIGALGEWNGGESGDLGGDLDGGEEGDDGEEVGGVDEGSRGSPNKGASGPSSPRRGDSGGASSVGAGTACLIRSVTTPFGEGLVRKIRGDGTLVVDLIWDTSAYGAHGTASNGTSSNGTNKNGTANGHATSGCTALAVAGAGGGGGISAADVKPSGGRPNYPRPQLFLPAPYGAVLGLESWAEHERARRQERDDAAVDETQDLFRQLLAEAKAEEGKTKAAVLCHDTAR